MAGQLIAKYQGFSLLELLVALAIIMTLTLLAVPSWQQFSHNQQASIVMHKLSMAIQFARLEAIRRNETVIVCGSSDQRHCSSRWRDGQLVITANGKVLRVLAGLPRGDDLIWRGSFGSEESLELLPMGYAAQQGRFYYRRSQQIAAGIPVLVVSQSGRVRIEY